MLSSPSGIIMVIFLSNLFPRSCLLWVLRCFFKFVFYENLLPHPFTLHVYGFSAVWILKWSKKLCHLWNILLQVLSSHLRSFEVLPVAGLRILITLNLRVLGKDSLIGTLDASKSSPNSISTILLSEGTCFIIISLSGRESIEKLVVVDSL